MYVDGWVFWHKLNGLPAALGFCRLGKLILHVALNMHLLHSACSALNSPLNTRENVARGRWGSTRNTDAGILCAAGRACLPGPWPVMFSDLPSSRFNRQVISGRACAVDRHPWMSEESLRLASFSPLKTLRILRIHSLEVHKGFSPVCLGPHSMEYMFTVQDADGA